MGARNGAMKRILLMCVLALMALALCAPVLAAAADDDVPVSVAMDLSNNRFTGPEEITVTVKVTNITEDSMPGPVTLYYPDGSMVQDFGSPILAAGQTQTWTGTWTVTESQLELGRLTFALRWYVYDENGELKPDGKYYSKSIIFVEAEPSVEVNRFITPTMAREGQEVSVTYEIVNTGTVDITNVSIRENSSVATAAGTIDSVPAGERASYTFTVKMGKKDITSKGTITYRAGNTTGTATKEEAVIKYGEIKLEASLTADKKGGVAGDTVKLTLTLKNTGSADYQNVTVTDAQLGELFTGLSVPAKKTVTQEKEITITGSADYQFIIAGQDAAGATIETATQRVSIVEIDPSQAVNLTVDATADRETLYSLPGVVRFKVQVTNNSTKEVKNVSVSATGVTLYTFPSIQPGETREFTRDVSVSMGGQYRFDAAVTDELEQVQTFQSNIIQLQFAQPTAEPTNAPIVTPPAPVYEALPTSDGMPEYINTVEKLISVFNHIFLILAGVCGVLLIVGAVRRIQANSRAKDHLERSSARVYDMPAPKDRKPRPDVPDEPEQDDTRPADDAEPDAKPGDDAVARDGALMEETLRQLYQRAEKANAPQPVEPEEVSDEEPDATAESDGDDEPEQDDTRPADDAEPDAKPGDDAVARDGALMEETLRQLYQRAEKANAPQPVEPEEVPDEEPDETADSAGDEPDGETTHRRSKRSDEDDE